MTNIHTSAVLIMVIGVFDTIDGAITKIGKMKTKIRALYDVIVERLTEFTVFFRLLLST